MPLLDHFHPPLDRRSWESFYGSWGCHLAGQLNMRPMRYGFLAESNVHNSITVVAEITERWPPPPLVVPVDFSNLETFEIRIYDEHRARTLVAAVELVSPGNKDRPENRRAFLDKCAAYLREGVSVVVVDIVNPNGFGFVKDRQHVAGFQEHQVSELPSPPGSWKLQHLDLIGLVVHEKPVVYISDYLPRMDELRAAPIRPVDDFEAAGLRALEGGEELFVRDQGGERRMLGAIRAVRQCLSCHGGERGDLLGAFAYRLTK